MRIGAVIPLGVDGEFAGWESVSAWGCIVDLAKRAEDLGFESIWVPDHLRALSGRVDAPVFESFTALSALASATSRVGLGHLVACSIFRSPGLAARMIQTMNVISGGRMEVGIGSGWFREEWVAYGYAAPDEPQGRVAALASYLEVFKEFLERDQPAAAPPGLRHPPIIIGGNGQKLTWRLAALHADELNLDGMTPDQVAAAIPIIRRRCEEVGRDPATLRLSVGVWWGREPPPRSEQVDRLTRYGQLGLHRVMIGIQQPGQDFLAPVAAAARRAGLIMSGSASN